MVQHATSFLPYAREERQASVPLREEDSCQGLTLCDNIINVHSRVTRGFHAFSLIPIQFIATLLW